MIKTESDLNLLVPETLKKNVYYFEKIEQFAKGFSEIKSVKKPIDVYPDSYIKSWGFPSGISLVSEPEGLVFPAAVPDIGCGFRVVKTNLHQSDIHDVNAKEILESLELECGVDSLIRKNKVKKLDLDKILFHGVNYLLEIGIGTETDQQKIQGVNAKFGYYLNLDEEDKLHLIDYFGVCAGHFLEVRYISEFINKDVCERYGLFEGQVIIIIHSGSMSGKELLLRKYYYPAIEHMVMNEIISEEDIEKGIFGIPINSNIGKDYIKAANTLMNYSYASRHYAQHDVERVFKEIFSDDIEFELISDICHSKIEFNENGELVHARGLQNIYPQKDSRTLPYYKETGDIALLAGEKGTSSHLVIPKENISRMNYLSSHGTGRFNLEEDMNRTIPRFVMEEASRCVFDTPYDMKDELKREHYNTVTSNKILTEEFNIVENICRLAPFINYWGEKDIT